MEDLIDAIEKGDMEKLKIVKAELRDARRAAKKASDDYFHKTSDAGDKRMEP